MKLSAEERQSLAGPAIVGCLFGLLAAFAAVAFHSEYGTPPGVAASWFGLFVSGALAFASVAGGCFVAFGAIPVALERLRSRGESSRNA